MGLQSQRSDMGQPKGARVVASCVEETGMARFDRAMATGLAGGLLDERGAACSRRRFVQLAVGALCACCAPSLLVGCTSSASAQDATAGVGRVYSDDEIQSVTLFLFDTVVQIDAACSEELMGQVSERLIWFENTFSRTIEGSDVWNINNAQGSPVEVAPETADCIAQALGFAEATGGLFDITIGAVSSLWDFVEGVKPDDAAIQKALAHVDYRGVSVEGNTVILSDPQAMIDLGGIAKGYMTDDIVGMLAEGGCESACISLGGNVYVMGTSFDGDAWNVGVQDPNGAADSAIASIEARDASIVTSGLYERGFEQDGVFYYHILDPKTGYPAKTDLESSSIRCASSTTADAYSTTLFLMGHDAAMELVEGDDRFECVLIDDAGAATTSVGSSFALIEE